MRIILAVWTLWGPSPQLKTLGRPVWFLVHQRCITHCVKSEPEWSSFVCIVKTFFPQVGTHKNCRVYVPQVETVSSPGHQFSKNPKFPKLHCPWGWQKVLWLPFHYFCTPHLYSHRTYQHKMFRPAATAIQKLYDRWVATDTGVVTTKNLEV